MSLQIQYASDLHLEFPANKAFIKQHRLLPVGEVLVLAGDIVPFAVMNYPEQYKGEALNEAFAVELYYLIQASGIDFWVHGHHHVNTPEFSIGSTFMNTNQLGYVQRNEHGLFEANKCIYV